MNNENYSFVKKQNIQKGRWQDEKVYWIVPLLSNIDKYREQYPPQSNPDTEKVNSHWNESQKN